VIRGSLLALLLVGCGTSGEPMKGDVTVHYGSSSPKMEVGTAVAAKDEPGKMLVQLGSDNVDCDTYLDVFLDFSVPHGTFVYFVVDQAPGVHAQTEVSTMKSSSSNISINGATGMVTIDSVEDRVTGSVVFTTTDQDVGEIAVAGTFDVKRCF
jgi:hypothetical protein